jgi:hypothetical protein
MVDRQLGNYQLVNSLDGKAGLVPKCRLVGSNHIPYLAADVPSARIISE